MNNSQQEVTDIQETELGGGAPSRQKRIIYFSNGETLEEEDSEEEEEEEEEEEQSPNRGPFREPAERSSKTRFSFKNVAFLVGRMSLMICDFLGERAAGALGLNAAKYQYAIDQYQRDHKTTTSSQTTNGQMKGQAETTHLSPGLDGSPYGATADTRHPADPQKSCDEKCMDRNEGRHNRAYEADEE
ncbi:protein FAM177B isoform X2 [Thunnus maccoyii]|uniref:protein FAM177B isoform X2 n=1 Tax=Thunnus maccoyii TaxID=8240 RepID=UPI001C4C2EAB|nr:protein FAM177B isoform X2 [Thunnus maccoyii]